MTSSEKRFVKTLPGRGGMFTRVLSRSRMSRKASKSEYRRRTTECRSLNAGMFVCGVGRRGAARVGLCGDGRRGVGRDEDGGEQGAAATHLAHDLVVGVHLPTES